MYDGRTEHARAASPWRQRERTYAFLCEKRSAVGEILPLHPRRFAVGPPGCTGRLLSIPPVTSRGPACQTPLILSPSGCADGDGDLSPVGEDREPLERTVGPSGGELHHARGQVRPAAGSGVARRIRAHARMGLGVRRRRAVGQWPGVLGCGGSVRARERAAVQGSGGRTTGGAESGRAAGAGGGVRAVADSGGAVAMDARHPRRWRRESARAPDDFGARERRKGAASGTVVPASRPEALGGDRCAEKSVADAARVAGDDARGLGRPGECGARACRASGADRSPLARGAGDRAVADDASRDGGGGDGGARDAHRAWGAGARSGGGERRDPRATDAARGDRA